MVKGMQPIRPATSSSTTTPSSLTSTSTPPGFNKTKRDKARWLLSFAAACLLSDHVFFACALAAASIVTLKEGTFFSHKNMKWMILSFITFCTSLTALILQQSYKGVDENRAYGFRTMLWMGCKMISVFWGVTLSFFLIMAFMTSAPSTVAQDSTTSTATAAPVKTTPSAQAFEYPPPTAPDYTPPKNKAKVY